MTRGVGGMTGGGGKYMKHPHQSASGQLPQGEALIVVEIDTFPLGEGFLLVWDFFTIWTLLFLQDMV